jgi:hypothetical protein
MFLLHVVSFFLLECKIILNLCPLKSGQKISKRLLRSPWPCISILMCVWLHHILSEVNY